MRYSRIFLFVLFSLLAGAAHGQSSAELKRRRDALTREIEQLSNTLSQTSSNRKLSLKQVNLLNASIRLREKKINTINSEISTLNSEISNNNTIVSALQNQLDHLKKGYAEMVYFAFRNQSAYDKLMFLFAAKDFNQGYKRLRYLQQFAEYRKKQAEYIANTSNELHLRIVELGQNKEEKSHLLSDQEKERRNLGKERLSESKVLKSLTKQEKEFKQELEQKKRDAQRLAKLVQDAIRREIEEEQRAADAEAAKNGTPLPSRTSRSASVLAATPESARLSSDFLGSKGSLPWPVSNGTVLEQFGTHTYGVNVKVENNGIDIKTNTGAAVRAVFAGTVGHVTSQTVIIRHGEYFSVYANLKSVSVSTGQKVTTKQTIGTVATNSDDGLTQLHFEIYKGLAAVDPENWLAN